MKFEKKNWHSDLHGKMNLNIVVPLSPPPFNQVNKKKVKKNFWWND